MWAVFIPLACVAGLMQTDGVWDIYDIAFLGFLGLSLLAWAFDAEASLPR